MDGIYKFLRNLTGNDVAFDSRLGGRVAVNPTYVSRETYIAAMDRYERIVAFQRRLRDLFKKSVFNQGVSDKLFPFLANDSLGVAGRHFYERIPESLWTTPLYFRTDESRSGKLFEIQNPGSGWGDIIWLQSYLNKFYSKEISDRESIDAIVNSMRHVISDKFCSILHLLDNSSNPAGMRFFLHKTQPPFMYWGFHPEAKNVECRIVRSHSFYGLISENLFWLRVSEADRRGIRFDLPPLAIFDQKLPMALPFYDETKQYFTDEDRELFPYTYPVVGRGFRDEYGEWVDLTMFDKRPARQRRYFVKYAGCDTSFNWGSRAVFRLDSNACRKILERIFIDVDQGRPWIIQPEIREWATVSFISDVDESVKTEEMNTRVSYFYGPLGLVAGRAMYDRKEKVHGQNSSVWSLVRAQD
jgi:hypothetical protein